MRRTLPRDITRSDLALLMLDAINRFGVVDVLKAAASATELIAENNHHGFDARWAHLASMIEATAIDFEQSIS